jgi:hypothetical protein
MMDVEQLFSRAVKLFWRTRSRQRDRQGSKTGTKDSGERSAVTGGKHADGFVRFRGSATPKDTNWFVSAWCANYCMMQHDAACFLTSSASGGLKGKFNQPNEELGIRNFAISLHARASAFAKMKRSRLPQ